MNTTSPSPIILATVKDQDRTRFGQKRDGNVLDGTSVRILPGDRIELQTTVKAGRRYVRDASTGRMGPSTQDTIVRKTFAIGDVAQVGSYNLVYTGIVRSITEKTVTVVEYAGTSMEKTYRFSIYRFALMNRDFDRDEAAKRNSEWMD